MPFHIKTPSVMNPTIGDVYYTGDNRWTETYDDRKVYANESDANADKATTVTKNGVTYTPKHFANATVGGRGLAMLKAAGIKVTEGIRKAEADRDHAGFFSRIGRQRPFVTLKLAMTLDGRIATATGESKWITGPQARREVHMQRARHDAVMVGAGTVRADDPSLTVRDLGITRQPVRVVVSRRLDLPTDCTLTRTANEVPVWLCHGADAKSRLVPWADAGVTLLPCGVTNGQVDLASALAQLAENGLTRVFCEGGGTLAASLLHANLVDELIVFSAGMAIGAEGTPGLATMGIDRLTEAPRFELTEVKTLGPDVMTRWRAGV